MQRRIIILFLTWFAIVSQAQISLVKDHRAMVSIVLSDTTWQTRAAAELLNRFIERMSHCQLPILTEQPKKGGVVVIGFDQTQDYEDGFRINCIDNRLEIFSGGDKGAIMGVSHLLTRCFNCDYYTKNAWRAPEQSSLSLPRIDNWKETPAFRYRQSQSYGNEDSDYRLWFGFEQPNEMFVNGMWVHTFDRILPASRYGKEHPEWYSLINGRRQPGNHSQWCLTNPEVLEAATRQIDSIFRANPKMKMISVSQNDGNNTQCHCEACEAVYKEEGAVSGAYVRFMNELARRFPDKEISTLAYLFTMQPPKKTRPLPNVNIMLCDIDCKREVPLTDNKSGQDFMHAIEGWSKISNNIFVWDYGINFDNVVAPFPNFHVLQPNIQIFHKHHANMLFEQVNGTRGTDFAELRAYMIGKLMWNPYLDADSLMRSFLDGYYGAAGQPLYQYRKVMEGALLASNTDLWIYDSPNTHKEGMLNPHLMKVYNNLFDQAEQAVADDATLLKRVRMARLPLQYAELERLRTEPQTDVEGIKQKVELFRERCKEYDIPTLNERNNRPADYCDLYLQRFLPSDKPSKAIGSKIIYKIPPTGRYRKIADFALTDGLYGGASYVESWVGWEGTDALFTIDLGEMKPVKRISADFLHQLGAWVLLPKSVAYEVSTDGKVFQPFGQRFDFAEDRELTIKFVPAPVEVDTPQEIRYIRVDIKGIIDCPSWHYGVGYPAWFFCDEVSVE